LQGFSILIAKVRDIPPLHPIHGKQRGAGILTLKTTCLFLRLGIYRVSLGQRVATKNTDAPQNAVDLRSGPERRERSMEDALYDIYIAAFFLIGLVCGSYFSRRIVKTRLQNRPVVFQSGFRWAFTLCLAFVFGYSYWYYIEPQYCVAAIEECERGGDLYPEWEEDKLVRMGPRGFGAIFDGVRGGRVFYRGNCLLPAVLAKMGSPAHQALLAAIDEKKTGDSGLIYTLQAAFHDSSRLPLWIDAVVLRDTEDPYLENIVRQIYPDAPSMANGDGGNRVNLHFVIWYRKRYPNRLPAHDRLERW
jgi:hypothetical protein